MNRLTSLALVSSLSLIALSGCAGPGNQQPQHRLTGTEWQVRELNGMDVTGELPGSIGQAAGTLNFGDDGRLYGRAFCNGFQGGYRLEGDKLETTGMASTMMLCTPAQMEREQLMLDMLGNGQRIEFTPGGELVIHANDGRTLTAR
ncbi:META domain-containing protein [Zobellella endophytica]|nr:META domain-containing protein [Zobellella endophytica]